MTDQSGSSHLQVLFEAALQDYQKQTDIALAEHPLAEKLQNCNSVESVTTVLREQTQAFSENRGKDRVLKPLKTVLSGLHKLSAAADFGSAVGLHFTPVKAIHTGLGVLLSAVKGVIDDYDSLVDLLESIDHFLKRLDIYDKIPQTDGMTEIVVKILVELLSTLALVTKQIKEGKPKKILKKLLGGEKDVEAVLQRLDRLTMDEARITAAQTLEVVYGLICNIKVVMDDGKASAEHIMETLKIMQQIVIDQTKSKHEELQQNIFKWLSPPDPWKNHHIACDSHHSESAAWFVQGDTFAEWKASEAPSSSLWIQGKPGAGKSVFCSTIIEDVDAMRKAGLASLAFFYCDFREEEKTGLRGLLSSLLAQLCHQSDLYCDIVSKLYSDHAKGLRRPSDKSLVGCLKDLLNLPGLAPVYIVVDALDECPNTSTSVRSSRDEVLNLLKGVIDSRILNLRICVTSRPEADIKNVLDPLILRRISLHDEKGQNRDIEAYIKSAINAHPKSSNWEEGCKQLVIGVLTKKAGGMFRWVECQMAHICVCIPAGIEQALDELPETLDGTYERILREINQANREFAHRLLQFVAVASRPLRVEELAELLAFDFNTGTIPKFREDWRMKDPVDAVSICSSLLVIVDGSFSHNTVQFSHFSVMEFLTSSRLVEASDITLRRYSVSIAPAHTLVSRTCLGMLLHLDKDVVTRKSLKKWPLVEYAAEHWAGHARFEGASQCVDDGMKQLFDPGKPHLAAWVWIHVPDVDRLDRHRRTERPLPLLRTPLHYAAHWGLHLIIEYLVTEGHSQNMHVDLRSFPDNATPLHLASRRGHMKAARTLIEHGADVKAKNKYGSTPLDLALEGRDVDLEVIRMLIEHGTDVTAEKSGSSRLCRAVEKGDVEVARMLIEHGVDVTARTFNGTPLHAASRRGRVEIARMLIERGADVKAHDMKQATPLHEASLWGQVEVGCLLIDHGADMTAQNEDGETPLHQTSNRGSVEFARMLIGRGTGVTAKDKRVETPLHRASREGQVEIARMLIEQGVDVTAQNQNGETPLHLALASSHYSFPRRTMGSLDPGHVKVAHMLIEHSGTVTTQNKDGETPLHLASQEGQVEAARMLIERDADVTALNKNRKTPIHLALQKNHAEVARMLIKHSADVMAQYEDGETLLHLASQLGEAEVARMLIERGADVTALNKNRKAPIHLALQNNHAEVARMLIEHSADVMAQYEDGETVLHLASQVGEAEVARMLIERGADVTAQNTFSETPLHVASSHGQVEVALMLIDHGADVRAQNENGETPLHRSSQKGQVEVAHVLIERGADVTVRNKIGDTLLHLLSRQVSRREELKVEVARVLIEHGADVTAQKEDGESLLHLALTPLRLLSRLPLSSRLSEAQKLTAREVELARMLIDRGVDVAAQNMDGETPLFLALTPPNQPIVADLTQTVTGGQRGQVEVACMLIDHGADVTAQNKDGETPLHLALTPSNQGLPPLSLPYSFETPTFTQGEVEVVRMLIDRGADATAQNKDRNTPFHLALTSLNWNRSHKLAQRDVEVVQILIDGGADFTAQNKDGETPLHLASRRAEVAAVRMLIDRGADITAQNKHGETALHLALQRDPGGRGGRGDHVEVARILIEHSADVTVQDENGENPLHLASRRGQAEIAHMLIERGADVTVQNKHGLTPIHLALTPSRPDRWFPTITTELTREQLEVARMLIEHGADVAAQSSDKETPLHLASRYGEVVVARMLIELSADVTAQNKHGETPLHLALVPAPQCWPVELTCGQVDIARMLIEHGVDVIAQNKDGGTPLHLASKWGQVEIVRMLVERGADVNAQDKDGKTPFRLATQRRRWEVTDVFLEHGADTGELPTPESSLVTSPAHNLADLPIPSHASLTTFIVADTDLPKSPSPFPRPPSNDAVTLERIRHPVFFTRRFLCSLGLVAIAVALPFFIRSVPQMLAASWSA